MAVLMTENREYEYVIPERYAHYEDDSSVMSCIEALRKELEDLHNRFNQATEPVLVDSIIYEMQAVQMRYMYYLDVCKSRGIVCGEYTFSQD